MIPSEIKIFSFNVKNNFGAKKSTYREGGTGKFGPGSFTSRFSQSCATHGINQLLSSGFILCNKLRAWIQSVHWVLMANFSLK